VFSVAIVGASGYSGAELMRLLSSRSDARIDKVIAGTAAGNRVDEVYPSLSGSFELTFETFAPERLTGIDVAFVALPSGKAMKVVPTLLSGGPHVIDLSGDFRLPSLEVYEEFYPLKHTTPELLGTAVYGLPELNKDRIVGSRLIANPGCYATSILLALLPALKNNLIAPHGIVINSLSGVSGAGRSSSVELSFVEVNENARAYKVGTHQHIPEIQNVLEREIESTVSFSFVPHLVPLARGIYTTIQTELIASFSEQDVKHLYSSFYADAPFVRIRTVIPQIKDVVFTNYCDIAALIDKRTHRLVIVSTLDNLMKGAAGQAIQNMNIMLGLPEETGLIQKDCAYV
jgi:N-acetyl-gamma-glutamyl-phosphate reductase